MDEVQRSRRDRKVDAGFVMLLRAGEESAFGLLVDRWADAVHDRLSHHGFTTADALDLSVATFATAHDEIVAAGDGEPFGLKVLRTARELSATAADRRVDLYMTVGPPAGERLAHGTDAAILAGDDDVATYLFETAASSGDHVVDVLDLHWRFGLGDDEIADMVGITPTEVAELLNTAPASLREEVGVELVWRRGTPTCEELSAALRDLDRSGSGARDAIIEHLGTCESCRFAASTVLDPLSVLAAVPIALTPSGFNAALVESLERMGLPLSGSVAHHVVGGAARPGADPGTADLSVDGDPAPVETIRDLPPEPRPWNDLSSMRIADAETDDAETDDAETDDAETDDARSVSAGGVPGPDVSLVDELPQQAGSVAGELVPGRRRRWFRTVSAS